MKRTLINLMIVIILFFSSYCKKEDPAQLPIVSTTPATNITVSTAISGGTITSDGGAPVAVSGICWSTNTNPSINDTKTLDDTGIGQFVSNLTGLSGGTTYHIRAYATNWVGTAYGADLSFTTLGLAPTALTQPATNISTTSATLNGTVNANHLSTDVTFEFGTTMSYGQTATANQSPITGSSIVNVSVPISGLTPGSTYHVRIKTVNSLGTTYGDDMTFTTNGYPPSAVTQSACCLSTTSASLNGLVNANYLTTTVTFEFGTTTSYGNSVTASQSPLTGNTNTNVSAALSGLTPGTTYHFRVKAANSLGTTYGSDLAFTTYTLIPTAGLVAYYPFNGNAIDESGVGNNGVSMGATLTTDRFGNSSKAYSFDGTSSRIEVPHSNSQLIYGSRQAVTFSVWVYKNDYITEGGIISKGFHSYNIPEYGNRYVAFDYIFGSTNSYILTLYNYSTLNNVSTPINYFNTPKWEHLVVIRDANMKFYVNGVELTTNQINDGWDSNYNLVLNNTPFTIGARNYRDDAGNPTFDTYFKGKIDDIRIYNRVLSVSEIQQLYHENGYGYK